MGSAFKKGLRDGIPIALGYLSVSFAFGIQAVACGLTPLQALLISMTNLTSAGQLAGITLISQMRPLMEMALTQLTINLRYALMSLALGQKFDDSMTTLHRAGVAFGNTDEIFAVAASQTGKIGHSYMYGLMVMPYIGWSGGTILGAVAGTLLPVFIRTALGIAIYGMFLAIIIPPMREKKAERTVIFAAAALSIAFRVLPGIRNLSSGYVIILCAVASAALGAWLFPVKEEEEES
ncbi:MAG: AzlC family ABC transporter permease [Clostridia bacterium]|nr:AzlC family ABC transporter permease [Clostridia bacterium]